MARRSRKKKEFPLKFLKYGIIGISSVFLFFILVNQTTYYVKRASIFKVKEVIISPSLQFIKSRYISQLKGQFIFDINLKAVQRRLQSSYPEIDHIRVIRKLPDRIYILARKREPFAVVSIKSKDILLDMDGVVLASEAPEKNKFPYIYGISSNRRYFLGKPLKTKELDVALDIILLFEKNNKLVAHSIESINVGNLSKVYLHLKNNIKVIMDQDRIQYKINQLGILLEEGRINTDDYSYIDLRFKEPILGKK